MKKLENFSERKGPLLLIIMDGVGLGKQDDSNAVFLAKTPVLDKLFKSDLKTQLRAHGAAVGLPSDGDMGNSEVGHNALGAGRVFAQGAKLVDRAIENGKIFQTPVWKKIIEFSLAGGTLHLIGLLSDGNVHSHITQLFALIKHAVREGVKRLRLHPLLDGRDVPEKSALDYIRPTESLLSSLNKEHGVDYRIASGGGRMITTMDRYYADWNIVKRGWDAHVLGKGRTFSSAEEAIKTYYEEDPNLIDQYMNSFVIVEDGKPVGTIEDGDSVIFFNFRGDRAIEISRAFEESDFKAFHRERYPSVFYAGMMEYDGDLHIPRNYLVNPPEIERTVSEYLCKEGVTMFAISETQKFGHVTYFWNGNRSGYIDSKLETYVEIPSDKIEFDKAPKMKAFEITEKTIELLKSGKYKFGRLNFANGDMVGHTGKMDAAIIAVETVDECIGKLLSLMEELQGITIITADHGNSDEMYTIEKGKKIPKTSHTLNPVPFIIVDSLYSGEYRMREIEKPGLSNVASTIVNLLGYEKIPDYDESLIKF
ncbi:MAG TPA: 2,3-bisphosphoglycerate-independent phosphoglycerate mutase [Candidatus Eremiobacteraeota bacterium]|nr:MAG: 2,3-bisphosphoglycerate-independent phosphoglycerate mutase [bacterium ADurb.Bin363]HPZ09396.1 2,3-bisphosphoglycerate-independent phosphoglycerate mutase [Candidatus Eremiobacteraeota bacterium]